MGTFLLGCCQKSQFLPQRSHSTNVDCMTPHGTIFHQTLDFDEFIPPIPPPPYYPPEYTCTPLIEGQRGLHLDFLHSPFSALYEVAINSPGMLYPSELPPPYEAVVGQGLVSQGTNVEQQVTEATTDERTTAAGFSTQVSVDSTSFFVSEIADMPDHTCSSEDLCSLEVQGSLRSADFSPYSTIRTAYTDNSCTSLEHNVRCGFHRTNSQCSPDDDEVSSRVSVDRSQGHDYDNYMHTRSPDCLSEHLPVAEKGSQSSVRENKVSPSLKPTKMCCGVFIQSSSHFQSSPSGVPPNTSTHSICRERTLQQTRVRKYRLAHIVRSTSDPVSCSSSAEGGVCTCAPTCSEHQDAEMCQDALQTAQLPSSSLAASACQDTAYPVLSTGRQKEARKNNLQLKPKALQNISKEKPHSLVDLKAYKDTKILVAKFLEHSNCNLPPEVRHVVNSIRSVIKSDERHMEEAIFSANVIDQVITSSQQNVNTCRKRLQEDLHLQSCGALSSPVAFLRRNRIAQSLERDRPHSLIGVCRETVL